MDQLVQYLYMLNVLISPNQCVEQVKERHSLHSSVTVTDFIEQFLQPCYHSPHCCILLPISTGSNRVLFTDQILHYSFLWQIMSGCIQQYSSPAKSRLICNLRIVYQPLQTPVSYTHLTLPTIYSV